MTKTIIARENTIVKSGVRWNLRKSVPKLKGYQDDDALHLAGLGELSLVLQENAQEHTDKS